MNLFEQFKHYFFTPEGLQELIQTWGYYVLIAIVFAETGLLIGFCLPGDSLLFMAGVVAGTGHLNFWLLNLLLMLAAIIGDATGYWIGFRAGKALFERRDGLIFKRKHLLATQAFYEKHGGKTIVIARFVPIIRTFAPVVAGIARMKYRDFAVFNIFGGIGWVLSMTTLGYFLGSVPWVQKNLEKMVLLIIFISILPGLFHFWQARRAGKNEQAAAPKDPA